MPTKRNARVDDTGLLLLWLLLAACVLARTCG